MSLSNKLLLLLFGSFLISCGLRNNFEATQSTQEQSPDTTDSTNGLVEITSNNQDFVENVEAINAKLVGNKLYIFIKWIDYEKPFYFKGDLEEKKNGIFVADAMTEITGRAIDLKVSAQCPDKTCYIVIGSVEGELGSRIDFIIRNDFRAINFKTIK